MSRRNVSRNGRWSSFCVHVGRPIRFQISSRRKLRQTGSTSSGVWQSVNQSDRGHHKARTSICREQRKCVAQAATELLPPLWGARLPRGFADGGRETEDSDWRQNASWLFNPKADPLISAENLSELPEPPLYGRRHHPVISSASLSELS